MTLVQDYIDSNQRIRDQLADRIIDYREAHGITQERFAKMAKVSRVYICEIETGTNDERQIRKKTIQAIEEILDVWEKGQP